MDNVTRPPCEACFAHDKLEQDMLNLSEKNTHEHHEIFAKLDDAIADVSWIKAISKAILVTMIVYLFTIGYYIFTIDNVGHEELKTIKDNIKEGETLHYRNERTIQNIEGKIDALLSIIQDKK